MWNINYSISGKTFKKLISDVAYEKTGTSLLSSHYFSPSSTTSCFGVLMLLSYTPGVKNPASFEVFTKMPCQIFISCRVNTHPEWKVTGFMGRPSQKILGLYRGWKVHSSCTLSQDFFNEPLVVCGFVHTLLLLKTSFSQMYSSSEDLLLDLLLKCMQNCTDAPLMSCALPAQNTQCFIYFVQFQFQPNLKILLIFNFFTELALLLHITS